MDLSSIKPVESKLELLHPGTGKPIGMRLVLCSGQDDRVKSVVRRQRDAATDRAAANAEAVQKGGKPVVRKSADIDADQLEVAAATIVGVEFDGDNNWRGSTVFSVDMAKEIASVDWIANQMSAKLKSTGDFFDA